MKAVIRLILTYFTGAPLSTGMSGLGVAAPLVSIACLLLLPSLQGGGWASTFSPAREALFLALPIIGVLALFLGSASMPLILGGFARGRLIYVLPFGRAKILVSAAITVALVSVVAGLVAVVLYMGLPIAPRLVFARTVTVMFLTFSLMYVIVWWISRVRSAVGLLGGAMLVIATLSLPVRFISNSSAPLRGPLVVCLVLWGAWAAGFLLVPHVKVVVSRVRLHIVERFARSRSIKSYKSGLEIDLLLGVARPWLLALGQIFPIIVAIFFIHQPSVWLFYFALFSAISGAITSFAATRSRSLWLRMPWHRVELFSRIEAAFWRHNSYALGILLLLFVAIGIHLDFQPSLLAFGLTLIALGAVASTYLGLMMTRGIGWRESGLAILTMLLLMGTAVKAAEGSIDVIAVAALELGLAVLGLCFRYAARRRWTRIDWTMCRPERDLNGRQTA